MLKLAVDGTLQTFAVATTVGAKLERFNALVDGIVCSANFGAKAEVLKEAVEGTTRVPRATDGANVDSNRLRVSGVNVSASFGANALVANALVEGIMAIFRTGAKLVRVRDNVEGIRRRLRIGLNSERLSVAVSGVTVTLGCSRAYER